LCDLFKFVDIIKIQKLCAEESKFHSYVERRGLRNGSQAWQRVQAAEDSSIPTELAGWVKGEEQKGLKQAASAATEEKTSQAAATA